MTTGPISLRFTSASGHGSRVPKEIQQRRLEDEMFQDLRYGMRMLLKSKMITVVAILSLALGIGANTAIFSLINALMLRMLPVKEPQELVVFSNSNTLGT